MYAIHFDLKRSFFPLLLKMHAFIKVINARYADPENLIKQTVTFMHSQFILSH